MTKQTVKHGDTVSGLIRRRIHADKKGGWEAMVVIGPAGAIELQWMPTNAIREFFPDRDHIGGIEEHHRSRPSWGDDKPNRDHCPILNGPCWHDGSSLYAAEHLLPMLDAIGEDSMWLVLEGEYRDRFERGEA